ncbi:MAG: helix-turn-helix transcriptional regulator [Chloroflexota bacterium]|nr:helix-turn-helix transcriptional regulator [Chloroflexota bacterium]
MIKNNLSTILGARRMSVAQLSRGANIRYATAHSFYEGKTTRFDAEVLDRLCRFLGVQVGDLLEYRPDEESQR